jgi:hypothetical protein
MSQPPLPDPYWTPVGLGDLAVMSGVPVDTVKKWLGRSRAGTLRGDPCPSPRWRVHVGKTPLWASGEWRDWLVATGRLPRPAETPSAAVDPIYSTPHRYVAHERAGTGFTWRTCSLCGAGAGAQIHRENVR